MFYCFLLLTLLWCTSDISQAICSNTTICVAGGNEEGENECQHHHVIQKLSDLTVNETNCTNVHIYLASGLHTIEENLLFNDSLGNITIQGALHGQPTTIDCHNNTGIVFGKGTRVCLSNIEFTFCQCTVTPVRTPIQTGLYFNNAAYSLQNITVNNTGGYGVVVRNSREQFISSCTFANNSDVHIHIVHAKGEANITITGTKFYQGKSRHISGGLFLVNSANYTLRIVNCEFNGSKGYSGSHMLIKSRPRLSNSTSMDIKIINSTFSAGSISTGVVITTEGFEQEKLMVNLNNSTFSKNEYGSLRIYNARYIIIQKCIFQRDFDYCSVIKISNVINVTLRNSNISNNNCTGIELLGSRINFEGIVNITGNTGHRGGAISLIRKLMYGHGELYFSELIFKTASEVYIANNSAKGYGGGIYTDETCEERNLEKKCFFQFEGNHTSNRSLVFSGNQAKLGGDIIFGGCLSNCEIQINETCFKINKSDTNNILWKLIFLHNITSRSTFVEYPKRVAFCQNTSIANFNATTCNDSHSVTVYAGDVFTVQLMAADDQCFPSAELIQVVDGINVEHDTLRKAEKICHKLKYSVTGYSPQNTTIKFNLLPQFPSDDHPPPALSLNVHLKECPIGFESKPEGRCRCLDFMESHKITCNNNTRLLVIPPQVWIGPIKRSHEKSESIAVQKDCHYCINKKKRVKAFSRQHSNELCVSNRVGVMCGTCVANYSLQLGAYECADCSNYSTYKGVLLLMAFAVIGIALVLLLLGLNLTVSTGMINGPIFYSNIVYLNSDTLLPITREGNSTHLQNAVRILSTFQAWMNLDFGIVTCFFDGYDTYISTWMQFVFPLYIWLLILIIVLASRYSSRISRITSTNTVSVLSTLMLLSYAKVLKSSFDALSFTDANFIDGSAKHHSIWIPDGNVPYLQGKHTPLFVMSLLVILVYILPFTLLILLGPLLQAKSHYRVLQWINKLKPFLDAFYGPYTSRYRYWPGILLLARLVVVGTFSFYSLGDRPYQLAAVSVVAVSLLALWMLLGRTQNTLLHQNQFLNFTELFFLINLAIFSVSSIYNASINKSTRQQQGFTVAMVGSVLLVFIGILAYQAFMTVSRYKTMRKFMKFIQSRIAKKVTGNFEKPRSPTRKQEDTSSGTKTTHSVVELAECIAPNELREPLLISGTPNV